MSKRICFITPSHISSNPRLIKEVQSLTNEGYQITILFAQTLDYLKFEDEKILKNISSVNFKIIDQPSLLQKLIQKSFKLISAKLFRVNFNLIELDFKHHYFLKAAFEHQADVYIAHNLAALPIAVKAAKKNNAKCGFDAEDFHRYEISDDINSKPYQLAKSIEDKYLAEVDYFTAASPLIAKAYQNLYPNLIPKVINNVFELKHQPLINLDDNQSLKLFWFSQTIGKGRGLEQVIEALNLINNPLIELHLLGNLAEEIEIGFDSLAKFKIHYYKPISNAEIFILAAKFDVGLALEIDTPPNRDICLTNKIFTYLISGLAIIASKTKAQERFMYENPGLGKTYEIGNIKQLQKNILELFSNKSLLKTYKENSYLLARSKYNWEIEGEKFIQLINKMT